MAAWSELTQGDKAPSSLTPPSEEEITKTWDAGATPLVSIVCATYQHAPFIAEALDGFLGQVTNFPFEVLVRDDASTDGTAEIVADYARRYPKIIKPVLEPRNTWPGVRAAFLLQPAAKGKYISFSEGDDYWAGPNHLAPLVEALENRADASAVFSPSMTIQDGKVLRPPQTGPLEDLTDRLAIPHFPGKTISAILARNEDVPEPPLQERIDSLDRYHISTWVRRGPMLGVPEADPTVYRLHEGGTWSPLSVRDRGTRVVTSYIWIAKWWRDQGDPDLGLEFEKAALDRLEAVLPEATDARKGPGLTPKDHVWMAASLTFKKAFPRVHRSLWEKLKQR